MTADQHAPTGPNDPDLARAHEIFTKALELPSEKREEYVKSEADSEALASLVLRLLSNHTTAEASPDPSVHDTTRGVGPYRLVRPIGEGGMGIVFLAQQSEPVRRQVALKLIKPGMDSKRVIARFEAERQALALIDHPNVARVLDAGSTDDGRPYFVMEYVRGDPITEHCDRQRLGVRERLDLFIAVCEAIQHAHQKGIIHRDIKPSNVLVEYQDARSVPKVIDFGVAKALHQKLTEQTLFTEHGQLIGTPEYMSPEQAEMGSEDIDTRTDVYSLGVLLYELLTGALPFDRETIRAVGLLEIRRLIREQDPPKPSVRLSRLASTPSDATTKLSRARRSDPRSLLRTVRGDLDWIVMKCLEKDRSRRYDTASALADDVRHYLRDEPVLAGPPSAIYRARKFARRHRAGIAAAAVFTILVIAGLVTISFFAISEARQRREAQRQAEIARAANDFILGVLRAPDPDLDGRDIRVVDLLDQASRRIDESSSDPLVVAAYEHTLGSTYAGLGMIGEARPHLERALEARIEQLGHTAEATLESRVAYAVNLHESGDFETARQEAERALREAGQALGPDHLTTLAAADTLAQILSDMDELERAEALLLNTIGRAEKTLGATDKLTLTYRNNLAYLYWYTGQYEKARKAYERLLEIWGRTHGTDNPDALAVLQNLARTHQDLGNVEEAESRYRLAIEKLTKHLGGSHPETLRTRSNLSGLLLTHDRLDEAEVIMDEVLRLRTEVLGEDHPGTMMVRTNLANLYARTDRTEQALAEFETLLRIYGEGGMAQSREGLIVSFNHAKLLYALGRVAEAMDRLDWTVNAAKSAMAHSPIYPAMMRAEYGGMLLEQERSEDAERELRLAYPLLVEVLGEDHERTAAAAAAMVRILEDTGRAEEARDWRVRDEPPGSDGD